MAYKIIYLSAVLFFSFLLLLQPSPESVIQDSGNGNRSASLSDTRLDSVIASRKSTIALKQKYLSSLKALLKEIQAEESSEVKAIRISHIAYSIFLTESRLAAEQMKLWQAEQLNEIHSMTDQSAKKEATSAFERQLSLRRSETTGTINKLALDYEKLITDQSILNQLKDDINKLNEEWREK